MCCTYTISIQNLLPIIADLISPHFSEQILLVHTHQHPVQIYHASTVSMYIILCVSVDGQSFGEAMWERRESGFKPSIHAPSDSLFAKAIKTVIDDMIAFKPADRPSARQVVQKLEELQAVMWQIGKFEVIKKDSNILGRGEMATVFLGEHPATREQVAVKEVSVNATSQSSDKFEEEGKTAMMTPPHKNVLKIHGVYSDHHRNISLVTELCQLGSLQHYVKNTSLTLDQKIDIILASVEALAHLHKQKPQSKLYRDIRPENMILSGTALEPVLKLSSVSVTRITKSEEDEDFWYYKAPEQTEHQGMSFIHSEKTEIFSMGMTNLALLETPNKSDIRARTGK